MVANLNWQNSHFQHLRSVIRIQSLAIFMYNNLVAFNCIEKSKMEKKRPEFASLILFRFRQSVTLADGRDEASVTQDLQEQHGTLCDAVSRPVLIIETIFCIFEMVSTYTEGLRWLWQNITSLKSIIESNINWPVWHEISVTSFRQIFATTSEVFLCKNCCFKKLDHFYTTLLATDKQIKRSNKDIFDWWAVWPDWAIYWTLGNFLKPLATINLPKSPTFSGNFCKGVKIYHFSSEIIFGQLL